MVKRIKKQKKQVPTVNVGANVMVLFLKEAEMFVAYSPVLDLSTCGQTFEEAQKNFEEAIQIFFEECIKSNTLDDVLTSLGWKSVKKEWIPPSYIGQVNVPLPTMPALTN
jgi:predicted RNase H-like HicB family nuclease